jgi:glycosyltransferase involved in cell wall biosynthesis
MISLVIPVYKNEANLDRLLPALVELTGKAPQPVEVLFVVDGSPDRCEEILRDRLPGLPLRSRLLVLSRNFGSFAAIAAGLAAGTGDYFTVMAADLQEPPELTLQSLECLCGGDADVVFGYRLGRTDPWLSQLFSDLFWWIYRTFVVKDMPRGGVDIFSCTRQVRDRLLELREVNTNLLALLFWLGFRRRFIGYHRQPRREGKSAWTFAKKLHYCLDSIFSFTDLPIQLLLYAGVAGVSFSALFGTVLLIAKLRGSIDVPGYTPIVLTIVFFGALASLALGIIGQYLWLSLQNTRNRPAFVVASSRDFLPPAREVELSRAETDRQSA